MKKNLATAAGLTSTPASEQHVDAINQIFALFRRNYHNQYFKAFPDEKELNITKRLWLDSLQKFSPEDLLKGARAVIETREYLPTLHTMIEACKKIAHEDFPDPHEAYLEACRAPSPKVNANWSHPLVYYAGQASDWYFLQTNPEHLAFPVYRQKYLDLCERLRLGESLPPLVQAALPQAADIPLNRELGRKKIEELKHKLEFWQDSE